MKSINLTQTNKKAMKYFSFFIFLFSFAFASCSKSDEAPRASQPETTTFTLSVDEPTVQASATKAITRATASIAPTRYIMEVWSESGEDPENVFGADGAKTNRAEILASSGSSFTVNLDKTKAYTCLFWADDNTFNAASLKDISLNAGKEMTEAYHANVAVAKGKNPAVAVILKRAVAKITLTEATTVKTDADLALTISNIYPTFNVMDAQASGTPADWTKTIKPALATGIIGTFYFFAKSDKELSDMKFIYAAETEMTVSNIPLQQNHATNIMGEYGNMYASVFTIEGEVEDYTENPGVEFHAKVGDFYYSNKTFSSTYTANTLNPCIGIVFKVNPDGMTGKIVSLDEAESIKWSTEPVVTGATSTTDGAANTATIFALDSYTETTYPAFAWCANKRIAQPAGVNWYIPAEDELKDGIYANKVALNTALDRVAGATQFSNDYYWSSTEKDEINVNVGHISSGAVESVDKSRYYIARVVSAF